MCFCYNVKLSVGLRSSLPNPGTALRRRQEFGVLGVNGTQIAQDGRNAVRLMATFTVPALWLVVSISTLEGKLLTAMHPAWRSC